MIEESGGNAAGNQAEPISIVGVGCRLPGNISTASQLRPALEEGCDRVTEIPAERWDVDASYDTDPLTPGKTDVRHGDFVTAIDQLDAGPFGISAAGMAQGDSQRRLRLETV